MQLLELVARQYRNLDDSVFVPASRFNVIVGRNAQGKTSLLEACYLAATLRPLRGSRLGELVRWGFDGCSVTAHCDVEGLRSEYHVRIAKGRRSSRIDGKAVGPAAYLQRALRVIAFIPDDLAIAKGGPKERRSFLDRAVFGWDPTYLVELREYNRCLQRRNALLDVPGLAAIDRDVLAAFDLQLAQLGGAVVSRRVAFLEAVTPLVAEIHEAVAVPDPARPALTYLAKNLDHAPDEGELRQALSERLVRDHARGATSVGPHRDDLLLSLDGRPVREGASQGQQRTLVLALKIAEIVLARQRHGTSPVLLLDDVVSELDRARAGALFAYLRDWKEGQVFVTTTDRERVPLEAGDGAGEWVVENGVIKPISP